MLASLSFTADFVNVLSDMVDFHSNIAPPSV